MRPAGACSGATTPRTTGPRAACRRGAPRHARAVRLRAHRRRDRRRPAPPADRRRPAARRSTPGRPSCERACRRGRTRSSARSSTPRPATTCRSGSSASTCARCGSTAGRCGSPAGRSSSTTWTAPPARSGASWRRCWACRSVPRRLRPARAGVPARELHPRRATTTGSSTAIYLPGVDRPRDARVARVGGPRGPARARCSRPPSPRSPPRPGRCGRGSGSRRGLPAHARSRGGGRLRRARPPRGVRVRDWPGDRRGGARDDAPRDAARRRADAARRRAPTC